MGRTALTASVPVQGCTLPYLFPRFLENVEPVYDTLKVYISTRSTTKCLVTIQSQIAYTVQRRTQFLNVSPRHHAAKPYAPRNPACL